MAEAPTPPIWQQYRPVTPKVELGKETRKEILEALRGIKSQIAKPQYRESTAADTAAEHLAGGGGLIGAAGAAAGFTLNKAKQTLKHNLDPLNIVNRLTGGSKLATVLAGRMTGRSEQSIRSRAGLAPRMDEPTDIPESLSPTPVDRDDATAPTPDRSKKEMALFEQMARSLAWIATHITHIALKIEAIKPEEEIKLFKEIAKATNESVAQLEEAKDRDAENAAEFHKRSPVAVGKDGKEKAKPETGGWLEKIMGWLKNLGPLAVAFGAGLSKLFSPLKLIGGVLKWLFKLIMKGLSFLGGGALSMMKKGGSAVLSGAAKLGGGLLSGAKGLLGKFTGTAAEETAEAGAKVGTKAAGKVGGKIAAKSAGKGADLIAKELETATKIGKGAAGAVKGGIKEKIAKVMAKSVPKAMGKAIPGWGAAVGLAFAAQKLMSGDWLGAAIETAGGVPFVGIPAIVAGIVRDTYSEIYSEEGKTPVQMETDPLRNERLPEIFEMAKSSVANFLSDKEKEKETGATQMTTEKPTTIAEAAPSPTAEPDDLSELMRDLTEEATVPSKVTELPAPPPTTGQNMISSMDYQKHGGDVPVQMGGGAPVVNIRNTTTNSTSVQSGMASPRSAESSYLRSLDRGFVPA